IGNNHHRKPFDGEDFQMFEKDLPGHNTAGFNADSQVGALPLETCDTINKAWGFNAKDKQFKSVKDLVHYLVRAAGYNANFLLNIGPMPTGKIQPEFEERLRGMGKWLQVNGESVYGTRGGPAGPKNWGVMTQKDGKTYVHVLDWKDGLPALPDVPGASKARLLRGGTIEMSRASGGIVLRIPESRRDPIDTIVVLER